MSTNPIISNSKQSYQSLGGSDLLSSLIQPHLVVVGEEGKWVGSMGSFGGGFFTFTLDFSFDNIWFIMKAMISMQIRWRVNIKSNLVCWWNFTKLSDYCSSMCYFARIQLLVVKKPLLSNNYLPKTE